MGLAGLWVTMVDVMILAAVALPLPARIALCVAIATACLCTIRSVILLRGPRAVRSLRWSAAGIRAVIGPETREIPAEIVAGSFRFGRQVLALRLRTCDGMRAVIIDGGRQEVQAFRRLCRHLESRRLIPFRPKV